MGKNHIDAELDVAYSSPEEFGIIVLDWLTRGIQFVAGDISDEILAGPPLKRPRFISNYDPEDPNFHDDPPPLWGDVSARVISSPRIKHYGKPYSDAALKRLRNVASDILDAEIMLKRNTDNKSEEHRVTVRREGGESGFVRLMIPSLTEINCASECREVIFMRGFTDKYTAVFGHISRSLGSLAGKTELGCALDIDVQNSLENWNRYLRGYSWVTIIPAILAERVGGPDGLRATGAFAVVEEVAGGSLWLLAADRWRDFSEDQAVIDRVFEALAPVLPPGIPEREKKEIESVGFPPRLQVKTIPYLLSIRDAAGYRSAEQ